jgi:DNA-binding transcriptional LysR family regulator
LAHALFLRYSRDCTRRFRNEKWRSPVDGKVSWDDLRLFLDVARLGGLSAARSTTRLSAATLGRRVNALERQIGEPLFVRSQTGYRLTKAGDELLRRAEDVEEAMLSLTRWRDGNIGDRVVRISAGPWTSAFLSERIGEIWHVDDGIRVELVTAFEKLDIGRRAADLGMRSELRPNPISPDAGSAPWRTPSTPGAGSSTASRRACSSASPAMPPAWPSRAG